ncbi:MAG: hypothetical protein ACP5MK_01300 [Candidatus Micrarchaeia archaeon]
MITDIRVDKVEANRYNFEPISNMKFNINFDDVKVEQGNVNVTFTFSTQYESGNPASPKQAGEIKITGKVISKEEKKDIDEIEQVWKAKKTLPIPFAENVVNLLNFECGARGTLAAYSIGLVAPLPLSRARLQETPAPSK